MVSCTHGNTLKIEHSSYLLWFDPINDKRQYRRFVGSSSDQTQSGNLAKRRHRMGQPFMFMPRDVLHPNALQVINCRAQTNRGAQCCRTGLEPSRWISIGSGSNSSATR